MSLFELFTSSDDFDRYRTAELKTMNAHIWGLMSQGRFEEAKGAMTLAKKIIGLAHGLAKGDQVKVATEIAMKKFQSEFIRVLGEDSDE